ncbi:5-formyltetrahydrofolate cyclo-ligase [Candidatus Woesearchaeota archaeon]|nr:5-formyltetrahydrofolate cyclo-ligase [Candidatus Woesearchaeota archaeon]
MKDELRKKFLELRSTLSPEEAKRKSSAIIKRLQEDPDFQKAKKVMFFVSYNNEVYTHDIIKETLKEKEVFVPKMKAGIKCCILRAFDDMELSSVGILEPPVCEALDIADMDVIIVPGVVFDRKGHRIGFGKGFYDELLRGFAGKKIGLAYDFQIIDEIPKDDWDVQLDKVISD